MSKKVVFPLIAVFSMAVVAGSLGCQASGGASAHIGSTEPKAATPPPPEPAPPAPPPPPAEPAPPPKAIKPLGKAKIENNEIKIPGKIHFDTDKATIKEDHKETKEILETVRDIMKENAHITRLRIEGHTDNVGKPDHNMKLSQDRADAVLAWLEKKGGIDKSRMEGKGWGQDRFIADNAKPDGREQNRRVEFKIWEVEGKATDAQKNDAPPAAAAAAATTTATPATDKDKKKDDKKGATPATAATPAGAGTAATPATPASSAKKP